MIVKQTPDDFRVEELTSVRPETAGPFALYRLEKTGWTTPDALSAIRRRWKIDAGRVSYGGLKDRHARTLQYVTILHGPRRAFLQQSIEFSYLGQLHEPYGSHHIDANRFDLTLRGLDVAEVAPAQEALARVAAWGVPNYFDDQRFGSVRPGEPFIARAMIAGDFESALKLALTAAYDYDRGPQKKEKALLRQDWGDWVKLAASLPQGHARSLVHYLKSHPTDFRGAVARLRPELRGLYLSAYQSHLWNRILARWLAGVVPVEDLRPVALRLGDVPIPTRLTEERLSLLRAAALPLASARTKLSDDDPLRPIVDAVLAEEGLTLRDMQIKGMREVFFSKGERAAHVMPAHVRGEAEDDELRPGKRKLRVAFDLPRGAYATLILKAIGAND